MYIFYVQYDIYVLKGALLPELELRARPGIRIQWLGSEQTTKFKGCPFVLRQAGRQAGMPNVRPVAVWPGGGGRLCCSVCYNTMMDDFLCLSACLPACLPVYPARP